MDSAALRLSYEAVPYESRPITLSHPDRIAAVAALHGLALAPADRCRVLELGCASGGNLIPMALGLPGSTFVGVDFAAGQVADGCATIAALGLANVSLTAMSIADIDDRLGTFDYIICHGVYSWVPPDVQAAILRVCSRNLAPGGIAYVSYNTYPGWHLREIAQDMIRVHDDPALSAKERAERGRAFVQFVADGVLSDSDRYGGMLRSELETLRRETNSHFVHEQLELTNQPVLFEEFARRAAGAGLQYVAEAQLSPHVAAVPAERLAAIRSWSKDVIRFEQYLDFLAIRTFRRTLLCHQDVPVRHDPSPEALLGLHIVGCAEPLPADPKSVGRSFRSTEGLSLTTDDPIAVAALQALHAERPRSLPFSELWETVRGIIRADYPQVSQPLDDPLLLATPLLECALGRFVELRSRERPAVVDASDRPVASRLARLQAPTNQDITNLDHELVGLDPLLRFVLGRLDGTRDRTMLLADIEQAIAQGKAAGVPSPVPADVPLAVALDTGLRHFAEAALLEG